MSHNHQPQPIPESPRAGTAEVYSDASALLEAYRQLPGPNFGSEATIQADPAPTTPLRQVPTGREGSYFVAGDQSITLPKATAGELTALCEAWFAHFPVEPSYAQEAYGTPTLLALANCFVYPDGRIGLCSFNGIPTGWAAIQQLNPSAFSYVQALAAEIEERGDGRLQSAQLIETDRLDSSDDRVWLEPASSRTSNPVLARARPQAQGFGTFIGDFGPRSVGEAWERGAKTPLAHLGLGAVATLATGLEVANEIRREQSGLVVIRALRTARSEGTAAIGHRNSGFSGAYAPNQALNKLTRHGTALDDPVVVQPFYTPPTLADLGFTFRAGDAEHWATLQHTGSSHKIDTQAHPGNESEYSCLFRVCFVYVNGKWNNVGGILMARRNGADIHGANDVLTFPVYIEGLEPAGKH